ncbi:MAG: 23S rRNA (guanosine(2251)-2'-O)-methyltransferase RlmB [Bryobacterales bacterium]|nr:23S rRNA (guanosine(2251)-2'-O)-methyltransferase RlmB [Bryobacterales bacterium]
MNRVLAGVNPVLEALRAGSAIERVLVAKGAGGPRIQSIIDLCRENGIPVRFEERAALDKLGRTAVHQGVVAVAGEQRYATLEAIAPKAQMIVVADSIEDPHNLGAIIRTAHAAGADAVAIPERRAAGVTPVVAKAAAGALEHLPLIRVSNINRALEQLKAMNFWIYGLDERGTEDYDKVTYSSPTVLVIGAEGKGLHHQVKQHCDVLVRIPMAGAIASLNVSVATGVALFDWKRRRTNR